MPLAMTRPWKHPNGMFWFRRAVPADLRALVGKREEKQSLNTKDPATAKQRHAVKLAEIEAKWANLRPAAQSLKRVPLSDLFEGWKRERAPGPKTVNEWRRVLDGFVAFIGHDDAARVTPEDAIRWKDSLVESGLSTKTIQGVRLAAMRAFFQWGVDNRRIKTNPAERVRVEIRISANRQKRSFAEEEAALILKSALDEQNPVLRWTPWLGAYSGARLGELCQLRREDIVKVEGYWCMKIDPDAGQLKNLNSERLVPIHPSLIETGFLEYVQTISEGPLFPNLSPGKYQKRGAIGAKIVGKWVRSLGLSDIRLSPSHSWRHRFKTLGRRHGLAQDIVEAVMGHARKTVSASYGEYPVEALHREVMKIPVLRF